MKRMISIFHRFGMTGKHTERRHGCGPLRLRMLCTCEVTTGKNLLGTKRPSQKRGRIIAAGMTKEVTFEAVKGFINDRIDDAYCAKYHGSPYLTPMISARARSATVKVMPRETNA